MQMANCSQINNTTIKGTSAVTYDSTPLPCTDVATCDGLNDILSKFDAVICDVKASVDSITEDVINLTEDLMLITEDIVDIQNQIFICCPICEFTGTADQLPDPTTTTTTTLPCTCVDIIISQADIDDATGNTTLNGNVNVEGSNGKQITCENQDIVMHYNTAGTYPYCLKTGVISDLSLSYSKNNQQVTNIQSEIVNLQSACTVDGECGPTTTTTTTTETPSCIEIELNVGTTCPDETFALFAYTDCNGVNHMVQVGTGDLPRFCVLDNPYPYFSCGDGTIEVIGNCNTTTTTTSTTLLPAPTLENNGQTTFVGANPNQCDSKFYPYTLTNTAVPKPSGFAYAIAPSGSYTWDQIEYVEIVNVFPSTEVSIEYNGLPVAPGMQLVPINIVTWEHDMFITRTTFDCTEASQIWTVRIKLYGYDISNIAEHTITYSEILCPNCTSSTTTTTTTEYCYCYTYEVTVTEEDLNESIDGQVSVQFRNCNEDEVTVNYDVSGTYILDVFENDITQTIETSSGITLTENQPSNTGFCCYTSPLFTGLRNNTGNETDTCSTLTTQIWLKEDEYGGIIRILNNSLGTIGFNGYNQFWTIQKGSNLPQNFRISNDGYIIEYGNLCS